MKGIRFGLAAMSISFLLIGCRSPKPTRTGMRRPARPNYSKPLPPGVLALEKITDPAELPYFGKGLYNKQRLLESIEFSQGYFRKPSSLRYFPYLDITHERAQQSLEEFKILLMNSDNEERFHGQIVSHFDVYRSIGYNNKGTVFFTGYCEPIYDGSLTPTAQFCYPLYKLPADLVKDPEGKPLGRRTAAGDIVPYHSRRKIESEGLLRGQELVYLKDKLEAFIVHVQGSARIKLPDGSEYRVGYAGKTDRPYTSIGKELIKDGKIRKDKMSLSAIKQFFAARPDELENYLPRNESFVFFTQTEGGPYGSIGVPVTPYRSIATDKSVFPRGCLSFMKTNVPTFKQGGILSYRKFESFALDQDTGGAIRSAGRADIFVGTGPEAEILAGRTQAEGRLYYIFVKDRRTSGTGTFDAVPVARNTE
jgi:membrane-bound lytic murein transglycosylase A